MVVMTKTLWIIAILQITGLSACSQGPAAERQKDADVLIARLAECWWNWS